MTTPDAIVEIDIFVRAWRIDEVAALAKRDQTKARECRVCIAAFEYLRERILEKSVAA